MCYISEMDGAYLFNTLLFFAIYATLVFFAARAVSKGKKARILKFFAMFSVLGKTFGVIFTLASMGIEIGAIYILFLGLLLMALTPVITNEIAIRLPKKTKSEEEGKETVECPTDNDEKQNNRDEEKNSTYVFLAVIFITVVLILVFGNS